MPEFLTIGEFCEAALAIVGVTSLLFAGCHWCKSMVKKKEESVCVWPVYDPASTPRVFDPDDCSLGRLGR
jgi:hypothetical protein